MITSGAQTLNAKELSLWEVPRTSHGPEDHGFQYSRRQADKLKRRLKEETRRWKGFLRGLESVKSQRASARGGRGGAEDYTHGKPLSRFVVVPDAIWEIKPGGK